MDYQTSKGYLLRIDRLKAKYDESTDEYNNTFKVVLKTESAEILAIRERHRQNAEHYFREREILINTINRFIDAGIDDEKELSRRKRRGAILKRKYVDGQSLEQIAYEMCYTFDYVKHEHGKAVASFGLFLG